MDPLVQALIDNYRMTPDLAVRVAQNLRQPGAAKDAYPAVSQFIGPPAIAPQPAQPVVAPQPQKPAPKPAGYDYQALKKNYPKEFHPEIDKLARAYGPNPKQGFLARANMGDDPVLYLAQQRFEELQRQQHESRGARTDRLQQTKLDADDVEKRFKRIAHYNTLIEQQRRGEEIEAADREWLKKVYEYQEPADDEDALLRAPGGLQPQSKAPVSVEPRPVTLPPPRYAPPPGSLLKIGADTLGLTDSIYDRFPRR